MLRYTDRIRTGAARLFAGLLTAVLCTGALPAAAVLRAEAAATTRATKVIRTENENEFAAETSKLAGGNEGLSVMSNGTVVPYSSARLIVGIKDGKSVDLTRCNAQTLVESGYGVSILQFATPEEARTAASKIQSMSGVSYVEPDDTTVTVGDTQITQIEAGGTDAMNGSSSLGGLSDPFGYGEDEDAVFASSVSASAAAVTTARMSWGASYIQADQYAAYVKQSTKRTIKVAVVDSGVSAHRMLSGRRLAGKDFVDNDNDPTDKNGHGTHVAGTIVDCTPGLNVYILPVRVMNASGVGNPSVVGNGIRYAVNSGAKVINLSLGGYGHYKYLEQCISYANKKGVTVVIASGNGSVNTKRVCPAHLSAPIIVAAINKNGKRAFFSNYGKSIDISAPGVGIRSCWKNGGFATADGTSMAAPHISAVAAMYRLMYPSYSPSKIEKQVKNYARDLGSRGNDSYYGRGVPRMASAIPKKKAKKKASIDLDKPFSFSAQPVQAVETGRLVPDVTGISDVPGAGSETAAPEGNSAACGSAALEEAGTADAPDTKGGPDTADGPDTNISRTMPAPAAAISTGAESVLMTIRTASATVERAAAVSDPQAAMALIQKLHLQEASVTESAVTLDDNAQADFSDETTDEKSIVKQTGTSDERQAGLSNVKQAGSSDEKQAEAPDAEEEKAGDACKVYVFPSELPGNAVIRDGAVVAGEVLALDAEIVPAPDEKPDLTWKSSDPSVASVDENGFVRALREGSAEITASIAADQKKDQAADKAALDGLISGRRRFSDQGQGSAAGQLSGSGRFTVRVVNPSVLTGNAGYRAGSGDETVVVRAVVRVPGSFDADHAEEEKESAAERDVHADGPVNAPARYVLALLGGRDDASGQLLGAVDLGGDSTGNLHVLGNKTDLSSADKKSSEKKKQETDASAGDSDDGKGILRLKDSKADGSRADLSLTILAERLRGRAERKKTAREDTWKCRLAVVRADQFADIEQAARGGSEDAAAKIEESAVCTCAFTLELEIPAKYDQKDTTKNTDEAAGKDESGRTEENAGTKAPGKTDETAGNEDPEKTENTENNTGTEESKESKEAAGKDGSNKADKTNETNEADETKKTDGSEGEDESRKTDGSAETDESAGTDSTTGAGTSTEKEKSDGAEGSSEKDGTAGKDGSTGTGRPAGTEEIPEEKKKSANKDKAATGGLTSQALDVREDKQGTDDPADQDGNATSTGSKEQTQKTNEDN